MGGISEIVHADFSPVWRGGQQQLWLLAHELRRRGLHQTLVAPPGDIATRFAEAGFPVLPPDAAARRHARHAQIVHAHDGHAHTWMLRATLTSRRPRPRLVLSRRVAFPIRSPFSRWKYRRLNAVLAISRFIAAQVLATGIAASRVSVIPDGVDLEALRDAASNRGALRQSLSLDPQSPCLVCLSAFTPEKGVADAIAALLLLPPDCHLVLPGIGPQLAALQQQALHSGCSTRVHFVAAAPYTPAAWVAAGDMLLMPSHAEGLGSAALLAMALNKPVIATRTGGIPELIEDGITGLLAPVHSPPALAAAVQRLIADEPLAAQLTQAARARLEASYTAAAMAAATLAAYARAREDRT